MQATDPGHDSLPLIIVDIDSLTMHREIGVTPSTSGSWAHVHASCQLCILPHRSSLEGAGPKWSQHCGLPMAISTAIGDEESWSGLMSRVAETLR